MNDNEPYLRAVSARIDDAILEFCRENVGRHFHADDLRRHVDQRCGMTAPGSADRILRDLRKRGDLNYIVVNRAQSLYRLEGVTK